MPKGVQKRGGDDDVICLERHRYSRERERERVAVSSCVFTPFIWIPLTDKACGDFSCFELTVLDVFLSHGESFSCRFDNFNSSKRDPG